MLYELFCGVVNLFHFTMTECMNFIMYEGPAGEHS